MLVRREKLTQDTRPRDWIIAVRCYNAVGDRGRRLTESSSMSGVQVGSTGTESIGFDVREAERLKHVHGMFGRDTLYSLALAFPMVGAFALTPILTRLLGRAEFGSFAANLTLFWILIILFTVGMNIGVAKVFAGHDGPERSRELLSVTIVMVLVLGTSLYATTHLWFRVLGFTGNGATQRVLIVWSGTAAATSTCLALLRCTDRLLAFTIVSGLQSVGALGAGILVAFLGQRSAANVMRGAIVVQAAALLIAISIVRPRRPRIQHLARVGQTLRFSLPLICQQLGYLVMAAADRIVVQRDLGPGPTGRYQIAYNVGAIGIMLVGYLNQAWLPRVFRISDVWLRQDVLSSTRDGLYRALMPVSLGLAFGGPLVLGIWAPPSFRPGGLTAITLIVIVSTLAWCFALTNTQVLLAEHRSGIVGSVTIAAAGLNVLLNIVLVPHFGIDGSAEATLGSYVAFAGATEAFRRRCVYLRPPSPRLWMGLAALVGAISATAFVPLGRPVGDGERIIGSLVCAVWMCYVLWRLTGAKDRAAHDDG